VILSDNEVGNLWFFYNEYNPSEEKGKQIRALIRKLVEERYELYIQLWKEAYKDYSPYEKGQELALADALQSFGIDPASWKEEL